MNEIRGIEARETLKRLKPYTPGKPIWEVRKEFGLDHVIKLASNENPLGPSPKALEAIRSLLPDLHRYPDDRAFRLAEALARRFGVSQEGVIVTNGGDELITLISEAFLDADDEIIVPQPAFSEYEFGATLMGAGTVKVPLRSDWKMRAADLLSAVTERTKIVYVCSPNNPTGTYFPESEFRELLSKLPPRVLVVIDAAYNQYADAANYTDGIGFVKEGYPVVVLQTFSKIYGLAGIRVGFGIGPAPIVRSLMQVKEPFNVNALAQAAAVAALSDEEHVAASKALNAAGRRQLYAGLDALGIPYTESMSNFLWVRLGPGAEAISRELLQRGIILRPGRGWGYPEYVRISVGSEAENEALLRALSELWRNFGERLEGC
ncbi:histidinol-phosphate transaminase [Cohnella laeviribosi]|uniref:histidinol-phosphate transaminase n=1 Tax=Cohnella laeviribosi TaxID=380174 RepID=UPI003D1F8560